MGGGGSKSQATTLVENNIVNRNTFEAINEVRNSQNNEMSSSQTAEVSNVSFLGCNGTISQSYTGKMSIMNELTAEQTTDMLNSVISSLENELASGANSESGFGDFMNGESSADTYQDIKNNVTNEVHNSIKNTTINETMNKMYVNQKLVVKDIVFDPLGLEGMSEDFKYFLDAGWPVSFDDYMKRRTELVLGARQQGDLTCAITQDAIVEFTSQQVGKIITSTINRNEMVQEAMTQARNDASAKTEGAGEAVADAAEGIGAGVAAGAEGIGDGVAAGAEGIGAGAAMAMAGPFIPFAIASSASMAMMMMMMMMSKKGGMDPAMMAMLARK
jgi:hypothetical protein